jgi:hypothetical protein
MALLTLLLGVMFTDNRVNLERGTDGLLFEPAYLFGVALDEHTLVLPLAFVDDAEGQKFLFYYMDTDAGLMALITRETLNPVKLSKAKGTVEDPGHHVVSCKKAIKDYENEVYRARHL